MSTLDPGVIASPPPQASRRRRRPVSQSPRQEDILRQLEASYDTANRVCPIRCKFCILQSQKLGFCVFARAYLMGKGYSDIKIQQLLTQREVQ